MNFYNISMLILTVCVGIATSRHEIRKNKVSNAWMLAGFIGGILLTLFFLLAGWYGSSFQFIANQDAIFYFINLALVFLGGYLLWKADFMDAGTAKLALMYCALIPAGILNQTYLSFFPTLVFLVNTFLLIGFYFVCEFVFFWLRVFFSRKYRQSINMKPVLKKIDSNEKTSYVDYAFIFIGILAILEIMRSMRAFLTNNLKAQYPDFLVIALAILFLIRRHMKKMIEKRIFFVLIVASGCALWWRNFLLTKEFSWIPFAEALAVMLVAIIFTQPFFRKSLRVFKMNTWRRKISIDEFSWPMAPSPHFLKRVLENSSEEGREILQKAVADKLDAKQTEFIKKMAKEQGIDSLSVQKRFPLAVWMFAGAILTIFARGPLTDLLLNLGEKMWKF